MTARPKNNLDELQRRFGHSPVPQRPTPATPIAGSSKTKFKPANSLTTSTPSNVTGQFPSFVFNTRSDSCQVRQLPSFSTPGFNKPKPPPLVSPSVADTSNLSIISVSSTDTAPIHESASSIPVKRISSGCSDDLRSHGSPKRARTNQPPDKENHSPVDSFDKDKSRARQHRQERGGSMPSNSPTTAVASVQGTFLRNAQDKLGTGAAALRAHFQELPHDADFEGKSEEELRGVCTTADNLVEFCNKQIGAARADAGDPRDVAFCNLLADYLEKRLSSARALLKAIQRGERQVTGRTNSSANASLPTASTSIVHHHALVGQVNPGPSVSSGTSNVEPILLDRAKPREVADNEYWQSYDDDLLDLDPQISSALPTPSVLPSSSTLLDTQHCTLPESNPERSRSVPPIANPPVADPPDLKRKPYYARIKETLTDVFGLQSFRALQLQAICEAMDGGDVFVLFPTGSGKSLTFQLPAVCQEGVTVVVSPLKSLILDQQRALKALGIDVEVLLGEMPESQRRIVWQRLRGYGDLPRLLYLTPERLEMDGMRNTLTSLCSEGKLARFVIDEAHLITDWGRSFRDSYANLSQLRASFPGVPITALTGTANREVQGDIISRLHLSVERPLKLSFNRPNLDYDVRYKGKNVLGDIAEFIQNGHQGETGIIYCSSRDKCEEVAKTLRDKFKLNAKHYHAQMAEQDKIRVQREWSNGDVHIIVATIAFGMGIDKADVRYVIHHSLPGSLNGYYQETGRAGRDGKYAHCILYYNKHDFHMRISKIHSDPPSTNRDWEEDDFRRVMSYCTNDVRCRRQQVLAFFSEDFDPALCHKMCNNCRDSTPFLTEDHTQDAQNAIRLFENLSRGRWRLTPNQFVAALKGSGAQIHRERGWTEDPLHGVCKHLPPNVLDRLVDEMLCQDFLTIEQVKAQQEYTQTYLLLGSQARALKAGEKKLTISFRVASRKVPAKDQRKAPSRTASGVVNHNTPGAGPSRSGPSTGPSSSASSSTSRIQNKKPAASARNHAIVEEVAPKLSLYRDDTDDDLEFIDDEIEISSPPPPRRGGKRGMPSTSQFMSEGYVSEIEEEEPPYRVTMISKEDLEGTKGDQGDIPMRCRKELLHLRDQIIQEDKTMEDILDPSIIEVLACTLPNDIESLRIVLENEDIAMELVKRHCPRILNVCAKYHMMR
ncbi:hypothetical protein BD414DRAFT_476448 [Trametes punicea]|nr:hypothetical protein BD414DRAFT_476448 [Trametes punicea]